MTTDGVVTWYVSTVTSNVRTLVATGTLNLTFASLADMYFGFGINAASASAETLTLDYVQCVQGRTTNDETETHDCRPDL